MHHWSCTLAVVHWFAVHVLNIHLIRCKSFRNLIHSVNREQNSALAQQSKREKLFVKIISQLGRASERASVFLDGVAPYRQSPAALPLLLEDKWC